MILFFVVMEIVVKVLFIMVIMYLFSVEFMVCEMLKEYVFLYKYLI